MPSRIAATADDMPPYYQSLRSFRTVRTGKPARQTKCCTPTSGDLGLPARTEAAIKQRRRQTRTTRRSGRQPARSTASISPQSRLIAHEYRNAVKHVFQASFELPVPAVLGEASRQAVQRRVAPGVNRVRGIEQLTGAVRVLDCLSLLSRADRAQAADNRGRGRLPGGSAAI